MNTKLIALFLVVIAAVLINDATAAEQLSLCQEPLVSGPCRGLFFRYGYDAKTNTCKEFKYGGCRGNSNNFDTEEECKETCVIP